MRKAKSFMIFMAEAKAIKNLNLAKLHIMMVLYMLTLVQSSSMIAMPFHPSNTYTIEELNANLEDIPSRL